MESNLKPNIHIIRSSFLYGHKLKEYLNKYNKDIILVERKKLFYEVYFIESLYFIYLDLKNYEIEDIDILNRPITSEVFKKNFATIGTSLKYYHKVNKLKLKFNWYEVLNDMAYDKILLNEIAQTNNHFYNLTNPNWIANVLHPVSHLDHSAYDLRLKVDLTNNKNLNFIPNLLTFTRSNNDIFPMNLFAFVGGNGNGKTSLLKLLKDKFDLKLDSNPEELQLITNSIYINLSQYDEINNELEDVNDNYNNLINYENKTIIIKSFNRIIHYDTISDEYYNYQLSDILIPILEELFFKDKINNIIDFILEIENNHISNNELSKIFKSTFYTDNNTYTGFNISNNFKKLLNGLSSGYQMILYIYSKILLAIELNSIIIYDEPENHLHPPLLCTYLRCINNLINEYNSICILATHSPIIIQQLVSKNVYILKNFDNIIKIKNPEIETFGESLNTISKEVFELENDNSFLHETLLNISYKYQTYEEAVSKLEDIINIGIEGHKILYNIYKSKKINNEEN